MDRARNGISSPGVKTSPHSLAVAAALAATAFLAGCGGSGSASPAALAPGFYRAKVSGTTPNGAFVPESAVVQLSGVGSYRLFALSQNGAPPEANLVSGPDPSPTAERPAGAVIAGVVSEGSLSATGHVLRYAAPGNALRATLTPAEGPALGNTFVLSDGTYEGERLVLDGEGRLISYGRATGTLVGDRLRTSDLGSGRAVFVSARLEDGGGVAELEVASGGGSVQPSASAWSGSGTSLVLRLENVLSTPTTTYLVLRKAG